MSVISSRQLSDFDLTKFGFQSEQCLYKPSLTEILNCDLKEGWSLGLPRTVIVNWMAQRDFVSAIKLAKDCTTKLVVVGAAAVKRSRCAATRHIRSHKALCNHWSKLLLIFFDLSFGMRA